MTSFDPYFKWLGIPPDEQPSNYYRLLGLQPFESNSDVIESQSLKQIAEIRNYQIGEHSEQATQLLNELSEARICLLDPERKAAYDLKEKGRVSSPKPKSVVTAKPKPQIVQPIAAANPEAAWLREEVPLASREVDPLAADDTDRPVSAGNERTFVSSPGKRNLRTGWWTLLVFVCPGHPVRNRPGLSRPFLYGCLSTNPPPDVATLACSRHLVGTAKYPLWPYRCPLALRCWSAVRFPGSTGRGMADSRWFFSGRTVRIPINSRIGYTVDTARCHPVGNWSLPGNTEHKSIRNRLR